ncbi:MAG: nickel pincer cofactor biosynthesis protein LarB [Clostridiales bacterium]|nr:nickel pincer cofactor biosynthesis protein LarB [Clostridia bacterium]MCR4563221.1 nickel pincer cofactor biosynthesis protein LarB [Clostridiales bacterium]
MNKDELKALLNKVADGETSVDEAVNRIKLQPYEDLHFAKIDTHRGIRQGENEVVYGEGKTAEQIISIISHILDNSCESVLITRLSEDKAEKIKKSVDLSYDSVSRIATAGKKPENKNIGNIVIATGGTSDIPVAEEAAQTAEYYGNKVTRLYDVGVSGVHRLFDNADILMNAKVVIAVAGMEGALASVVGGMVDCPVIAVPTSVGYGANYEGLSALLAMLNSCASGVSVVNIDNGFGAGYLANMINKM